MRATSVEEHCASPSLEASVLQHAGNRGEQLSRRHLNSEALAYPQRSRSALYCSRQDSRRTRRKEVHHSPRTRRANTSQQKQLITPQHHDGRQVARPAASFHRPRSPAQKNRRAHARAPMKPREWTSRRTAKRRRRDAGSPSSRRRAPRHRASASSPSRTPGAGRTSTRAWTNCKDARTTS